MEKKFYSLSPLGYSYSALEPHFLMVGPSGLEPETSAV